MNITKTATLTLVLLILLITVQRGTAFAQTTEFTYQGRLQEGGIAASGNFDFEFLILDSLSEGTQQGPTLTRSAIVSGGVFSVTLDFGDQFPGANRFLEIRVRHAGGLEFTPLTPRQQLNSSPYAIRSLLSTTAGNATQLGGVAANQYVLTGDSRLSDARTPLAGSTNYVQNTTSQQAASNFSISGNGTAGGTLSGQSVNSSFEYRLGGQPFLSAVSSNSRFGLETGSPNLGLANTYAGYRSGAAGNSNANDNAFFGANAGRSNSSGDSNSFFGAQSGELNTIGGFNAFFGNNAGAANTSGNRNTFVGVTAGRDNTIGEDNTFAGVATGQANQSGSSNSFIGGVAGISNTTGSSNAFFGNYAGQSNTTGSFNTSIGYGANQGSGNLTFATAIGAAALVTTSNTVVVGRGEDTVKIPGGLDVTGSITGTISNALSLGGVAANQFVQTGDSRLSDPRAPLSGSSNYIQNGTSPQSASNFNISGNGTAGGTLSGNILNAGTQYNMGGSRVLKTNSFDVFLGVSAGAQNPTGGGNTFVGGPAGSSTTSGILNSFFGSGAGEFNSTGSNNTYVGYRSGSVDFGSGNTFMGSGTGGTGGMTSTDTTLVGLGASTSAISTTNATAIGARAAVTQSNSLVLGSINGVNGATADTNVGIGTTAPAAKLHVNGSIRVNGGGIYVANPNTLVITSPNGACWGITVNNSGGLATFPTTCP